MAYRTNTSRIRPVITGLVLTLSLSACSAGWPEAGSGGQAEWRPAPEGAPVPSRWNDRLGATPADLRAALARWQELNTTLEAASVTAVATRPALLRQAQQKSQRARRELEGGLLIDGARNLDALEGLINALSEQKIAVATSPAGKE